MILRKLFLAVMAGAALLTACDKEVDLGTAKLRVSPTDVSFTTSDVSSQEITVFASRDWTVSNLPDWIALSNDSGAGDAQERTVSLTVLKNEGFNRTAELVFSIGFDRAIIKVTQPGPDGEQNNGDGTKANPFNVAGVLEYVAELGKDVESPKNVFVKGKIAAVTEAYSTDYGSGSFTIFTSEETASQQFTCYRVMYLGNKKWTANDPQPQAGDDVVIYGKVVNFKGTTPETVQNKAFLFSLNGVDKGGVEEYDTDPDLEPASDSNIAGLVAQIDEASTQTSPSVFATNLTGATVTYVNGSTAYLEDNSGAVMIYKSGHGLKAGDVIKGNVSGEGYYRYGVPQLTGIGSEFNKTSGTAPTPTEMTLEKLLATYPQQISRYIILKNVTATADFDSKRNSSITQGEKTINVYAGLASGLKLTANATGDMICFPTLYNTTKQVSFWDNEHFTGNAGGGEEEPVDTGLEPAADNNIAGIVQKLEGSTSEKAYSGITLKGAVVTYVNGGNAYLEDASGAILLYMTDHGLKAGDVISGAVSGTGKYYNGLPEIMSLGDAYTKTAGGKIPLTEITIANLTATDKVYLAHMSRRLLLKGVTVTDAVADGDRNGALKQGEESIKVYAQIKNGGLTLTKDDSGDMIVFPAIYNATKQVAFWDNAQFYKGGMPEQGDEPENPDEPTLPVNDGTTEATAFTVQDAVYVAKNAADATKEYFVKAVIGKDVKFQDGAASFELMDGTTSDVLAVVRAKSFKGAAFDGTEPIGWLDEVVLKGKVATLAGSLPVLQEASLVRWNGKGMFVAEFTTVAQLNAKTSNPATEYSGSLTDAVVSFVPATGDAIIKDATGSILLHKTNHGLKQGQTFTGELTVKLSQYNEAIQLTAIDAVFTGAGAVVEPQVVTLADLTAEGGYTKWQSAYVSLSNVEVTKVDKKNVTVKDGEATYIVFSNAGNATCAVGDKINATGTITRYKTTQELKVWTMDGITVVGDEPGGDDPGTGDNPGTGGNTSVEFDFTAQGWENQYVVTSLTSGTVTFTADKGSNSNAPKYYISGTAVRFYGGNYFTVATSSGKISKVELTFGSSDGNNAISADSGTMESGIWTGSAASVKLTIGGTTGNRRITKVKVTLE